MKQDSTQTILLIVIICVIVILIIGVVLFREKVFTTGKQLGKKTNDELQSMGYGTYSTVYQTPCLTSTGKCSTSGQQYITQYCVPHSTTGKGCINSDGEQTFAPQTFSQNCLPNCRKYVFTDSTHNFNSLQTTCAYPAPYNSASVNCIPSNIHPYFYDVLTCMNNDNVGDNACSYTCGQDGITSTHISGDSDPTLSSYIPACTSNKGKVITLNSMASSVVDLTNLPTNGFNLSKGFNVKNILYSGTGFSGMTGLTGLTGSAVYYFGPTGSINPNYFTIVPAYNFPKTDTIEGGIRNIVNKEELAFIDQNLIVYSNNCTVTPSKPICGNRYLYPPTQIQGNLTSDTLPIPPVNRGNIFQTQSCFVSPFWEGVTGPTGATGSALYVSNFKNPYLPQTGTTGPTGATGPIEGYNPLSGIGLFGITFEPQTCLKVGQFPTLSIVYPDASLTGITGSTGLTGELGFPQYVIPASQTFCSSLPESYTGPSNSTCYPNRNYIPINLDSNQSYNICNTEFPDGIPPQNQFLSGRTPGTTVNCQYMPPSELLNFTEIEKSIGFALPSYTKQLFGNYIQLQTDFGTTAPQFFLTGKTTPCQLGLTGSVLLPLTNCTPYSNNTNSEYASLEVILVQRSNQYGNYDNNYDGSAFWSKPGCENQMITYASSISIIISPIKIEFNFPSDPPTITCYLFGFIGNVFGMFWFDATDNGKLYFQPFTQDNEFDSAYYNNLASKATFVIKSYSNKIGIKGLQLPSTLVPLNTPRYDGQTYDTTLFTGFNPFTDDDMSFKAYPFEGPIIINGKDVSLTANLQRNNACYYDTCNPGLTGTVCYPNTCNLFYDYNPEFC